MVSDWVDLRAPPECLRLTPTLLAGMSFRWRATPSHTFIGVLGDWICELRETAAGAEFRTHAGGDLCCVEEALREHLSLDRGPEVPNAAWSDVWRREEVGSAALPAAAAQHGRCAAVLPGVRVLTIGTHLEALVTFVGSANNNIKRNMQMVEALCAAFPKNFIGIDTFGSRHFRFPSADDLSSLSEATLWELGWGYRAPRLVKLAAQLRVLGGGEFLSSVSALTDGAARVALCAFCGVGPKVADCILLFGYKRDSVVPVDTHCLQLARRYLLPSSAKAAPLSASLYATIVSRFHEVFGPERAGWAFMTLFVAELSDFKKRLELPASGVGCAPGCAASGGVVKEAKKGRSGRARQEGRGKGSGTRGCGRGGKNDGGPVGQGAGELSATRAEMESEISSLELAKHQVTAAAVRAAAARSEALGQAQEGDGPQPDKSMSRHFVRAEAVTKAGVKAGRRARSGRALPRTPSKPGRAAALEEGTAAQRPRKRTRSSSVRESGGFLAGLSPSASPVPLRRIC